MVLRYATHQAVSIAANQGMEDLCAAQDSFPPKDAVKRKTRLRDELFQDLMKVSLAANNIMAHAHTSSFCLVPTYKSGFCMFHLFRNISALCQALYALVACDTIKSQ